LLLFTLCGCKTTQQVAKVKDGQEYGVTEGLFRHNWWNYYERALSWADGKFWAEAENDLNEATKRRKNDQWRARTYGMHFVDYFPHRELGVVLYQQGRIEEAIRELELSLSTETSSKAQLYLDRARKALIKKSRMDKTAPQITLESPAPLSLTNAFKVTVQGIAQDDTYVEAITIGRNDYRIDVSSQTVSFSMEAPLKPGLNQIPVKATDLSGKTSRTIITVNVDRLGPVLQIDEPNEGDPISGNSVTLKGIASDNFGLEKMVVNGADYPFDGSNEIELDVTVQFQGRDDQLHIELQDKAGNRTKATIGLARQMDKASKAAREIAGKDANAPIIRLRDLGEEQVTHLDQYFIEGNIRDDSKVTGLLIDGEQILRKPARNVYFSHLVGLNKGENRITVKGMDAKGNESVATAKIRRDILKVRQTGSRLRVGVSEFKRKSIGRDRQLSHGFEDLLSSNMVKRARFSAIDRRDLKAILEEQRMSQTGLVDEDTAIEVGKIAAADGMLIGSVLERENSIEVYARLLDTETSEVYAVVDVYGEDIDINALRELCKGMDLKLTDALPVVEGMVVSVEGKELITDLGEKMRIRSGMKLIVFQIGDPVKHPATGKTIGLSVKELGQARIKAVMDEMSYAGLESAADRDAIRPMQHVITR